MTQTRKTTTLTAQQLLERHRAGEVFDGLVSDCRCNIAITGPITDTTGFVLVETEFGVLRYEPDQELEVLELPDRKPAAQDEGRSEPVVRLEVTENLTHLLEMPLSRYQELLEESDGSTDDGSPMSDLVSSVTSGSNEPGVVLISTSVDERWIQPLDSVVEHALEQQTTHRDTGPAPGSDWNPDLGSALLYGRVLFPEDHTTSTDTEETTMSENTTHHFTVTITGCDAEQAAQVMGKHLLHDEDYGFDYRVDYQQAPTHAAVCIVEDGPADIVLCADADAAEDIARRMVLLELAGTNWAEENMDQFPTRQLEDTARVGTFQEVKDLVSDASNWSAFEREGVLWGPGRIIKSIKTLGITQEPDPAPDTSVSPLVEKLIAAGTLSPTARTERASSMLTQLLEANATNRVRAKLGTAFTIECTVHEHEGDWWLQVPTSAPGTALLLATDATDRADTDALGWNVSLTDLQLLEPDALNED